MALAYVGDSSGDSHLSSLGMKSDRTTTRVTSIVMRSMKASPPHCYSVSIFGEEKKTRPPRVPVSIGRARLRELLRRGSKM